MIKNSIRGAGLVALALTFACTATQTGKTATESLLLYPIADSPETPQLDTHGPAANPADHEPVSLHGMLAYASTNAPMIRIAQARTLRGPAEIQAARVRLPSDPSISISAGPRIAPDCDYGIDVQLSVQQEIEIAGQRRLRIAAAERLARIHHHDGVARSVAVEKYNGNARRRTPQAGNTPWRNVEDVFR